MIAMLIILGIIALVIYIAIKASLHVENLYRKGLIRNSRRSAWGNA